MVSNARLTFAVATLALLVAGSGCRKKMYENPITKETQQPDKVLYDTSVDDIEHGRYERARIELQTLMNTYDTSEYLAKAKLAVADSWYREGGSRGFAQAEAEYKDFILFYKNMEEAAEAQMKICDMQFDQMDKSDRDPQHAMRAQDECMNLLKQFPNSQYATRAEQRLRAIQEVLADEEYKVEGFYFKRGKYAASANRGQELANQYPLYSNSAEGLWMLAQDYQHMGTAFENQQAAAYAQIAREYPLSDHFDESKLRLQAMERPVPDVDPVAYARAVYEADNKTKRGTMSKVVGPFGSRPYLGDAAKSGPPTLERFHPGIPASVPLTASGTLGNSANPGMAAPPPGGATPGTGSLSGTVVNDTRALDTLPDARLSKGGGSESPASGSGGGTPTAPTVTGKQIPAISPNATPATATPPAAGQPAPAADTKGAAPSTAPAPAVVPAGKKAKTLSQQESDIKKAQDELKKEKAKIQADNQKRIAEIQRTLKKQQDVQAKRKAQEDAAAKKAQEAAAKKERKQRLKDQDANDPDKQPDKPPDTKQPDKTGSGGGGQTAPAKQ